MAKQLLRISVFVVIEVKQNLVKSSVQRGVKLHAPTFIKLIKLQQPNVYFMKIQMIC